MDLRPRRPEQTLCVARQVRGGFGQKPVAGLEEVEPQLLAPDAGVVAQDVVGEGRQFPEQLGANEPAADDDHRQQLFPSRGFVSTSARSNRSMRWLRSRRASATVLKVRACSEPGIRDVSVAAPSATTRWS